MQADVNTPSYRWWLAAFIAILVLGGALRLRGLDRWSLNNDEICEVSWSSLPFNDMMAEVRRDAVHPPLDYLLQHAVSRIHGPEWTPRVPPVIAGIGTIAMLMLLGRFWFSPLAGLLAGLLLSVAPIHIRYSQEVRPYSLALLLITSSLVALELYARTHRRVWAFAWAALVFLAGGTLYFAGMAAGVTGIFIIFVERHERLRTLWRWLPAVIVTWVVLYSPWFSVLRHVARSPSPGGAEKLAWPWWQFRLQTFATGDATTTVLTLGSWLFWAVVIVGVVASAWRMSLRPAVVWLIAGGALQILVLQIRPHYSDPRYILSSLPAAYLLAGAGLAVLVRRVETMPVAVTVVLLFAGFSAISLETYYRGDRPDWRGVLTYMRDRIKPGDTIVLANSWVLRNFGYYWIRSPEPHGLEIELFEVADRDLKGPAWIVSGQCRPRPPLAGVGLMHLWPETERAQVRYLRPGKQLSLREQLCPE